MTVPLFAADSKQTEEELGPRDLDIYLLIGQSNMAGRAEYSESESDLIDRCYLFNNQGKWEMAGNPLNRYSTVRKKLKMQKMGPGYSFAKSMLEQKDSASLGLVVNARGGSKIQEWEKGEKLYNEALKRALNAKNSGTIRGILWHQGESNSKKPGNYNQKLKRLIKNLRSDLGDLDLPFVAGQIYYHPVDKPHTSEINNQIRKLSRTMENMTYVSSEGLTTYDNTHFDVRSAKILGKRYAAEMLSLKLGVSPDQWGLRPRKFKNRI